MQRPFLPRWAMNRHLPVKKKKKQKKKKGKKPRQLHRLCTFEILLGYNLKLAWYKGETYYCATLKKASFARMQMYRLNCQAIHRNMHGIHPQLVRRSTTWMGKEKNFCCVIHDWMLRLVFPWISSTPPADFYAMGIQNKVGFTMTITMTSSASTVPKGKAMAEETAGSGLLEDAIENSKCSSEVHQAWLEAVFYLPVTIHRPTWS